MKKIISFLISALLAFSVAVPAFAASGSYGGSFSDYSRGNEADPFEDRVNFDATTIDELSEAFDDPSDEWTESGIKRALFAVLMLFDLNNEDSALNERFSAGLYNKSYVCKKDNILALILQGEDEAICIVYLAGVEAGYFILDDYSWSKTKQYVETIYDEDIIDRYWKIDSDDVLDAIELLKDCIDD